MSVDLSELIERVEKCSGPDRALDWEIHTVDGLEGVGVYGHHPKYTSSLDAALALVEEKLPGWTRLVDATTPKRGICVTLFSPGEDPDSARGVHSRETNATLLALLRALSNAARTEAVTNEGRE